MRIMLALIKREYLEHRGAFVYAPTVLLSILTVVIMFGVFAGDFNSLIRREVPPSSARLPGGGKGLVHLRVVSLIALPNNRFVNGATGNQYCPLAGCPSSIDVKF